MAYFFLQQQLPQRPDRGAQKLAYLFEKYGYYMKIEVQTLNVPPDDAARIMNDFLENLLPGRSACPTGKRYFIRSDQSPEAF